ncbi:MAG: hypothetical protein U0521_25795 [Anaerolineae bacterium]
MRRIYSAPDQLQRIGLAGGIARLPLHYSLLDLLWVLAVRRAAAGRRGDDRSADRACAASPAPRAADCRRRGRLRR